LFCIPHPSISRLHATLHLSPRMVEVEDHGSRNGTMVGLRRLAKGERAPIDSGLAVHLGTATLVIAAPQPAGFGQPGCGSDDRSVVVAGSPLEATLQRASLVARGTLPVLVLGETGSGKEIVAEHVHYSSPRARGPLLKLNCAALPEALIEGELLGHERGAFTGATHARPGLIEAARGGTLLLDEVGDLPLPLQAKLLRVVESGEVTRIGGRSPRSADVRFVSATNRRLSDMVGSGEFRSDLYYRLAGSELVVPPLRERPTEIIPLAEHFLAVARERAGLDPPKLSPGAREALLAHGWPGNLRELKNKMEQVALLTRADEIERSDLGLAAPMTASQPPADPAEPSSLPDELNARERERILAALAACGGNQSEAARRLGMARRTLLRRLASYGIKTKRVVE
jgi:two-component system response regulator AtoC